MVINYGKQKERQSNIKIVISLLISSLLLLHSMNALGGSRLYGSAEVTGIVSVYDGDTFRVNLKGYNPLVGKSMPVRLMGIDAPEIRGKCVSEKKKAKQVRDRVKEILVNAKTVYLHNMRRGKYFRVLADVEVDGNDLANLLFSEGLVRIYTGGTRLGWCSDESDY